MTDKISASEALFGFAAWLTTLDKPVTFSARHDAGLAAELVGEFCKANGLDQPRDGWANNLVTPDSRPLWQMSAEDPTTPTFIDKVNQDVGDRFNDQLNKALHKKS